MVRIGLLLSALILTSLFCKVRELADAAHEVQDVHLEIDGQSMKGGRQPMRCHYVSFDSADETFTSARLRKSVVSEPEFARRGFVPATSLQIPDVEVHLQTLTGIVTDRTILLQAWNTGSQTTTQGNLPWAESDREHLIARKVIALLSSLCGEPRGSETERELSHEQIAEALRSFQRVQVISRTYLAPERLVSELGSREEIVDSRINVSGSNEAAEASLIIDHLPSIWWKYELVDLRSGTLLDSGSVPAFQESRAASRIADMLVLHLASYRSFKQVSTKHINSGLKIDSSNFGSWRVWQILETLENPEPVPREITVGLQGGNLIGSSSDGQVAFSIDTHGILDVDFDGSAYVRLTPDSMLNEYPNLLYYIKIPRYRVHIAWNDDNVTRIVTLQAPKARLRELYSKLAGVISP